MVRPSKPVELILLEGKSHRTKAEIETRKKAEQELLTGTSLKAWPDIKNNPVAKKEFNRIKKLLKIIKHDDALYEAIINRYCMLIAECKQFEDMKEEIPLELEEIKRMYEKEEISAGRYLDEKNNLHARVLYCDKKIMDKRKMLLSIEKENIMTIMASLRAIPKKPQEKQKSKMAGFLEKRQVKANGV